MCGIAGIIRFDGGSVNPDSLKAMTSRMVERGPDEEGFFIDGCIGLGFRRLSIIDIGGGHQPIANEDGTLQLVFNGEIYNHNELRHQLVRRGHSFRTKSDAEVLLHLYEDFGVDALNEVNGMFGFAIYDSKRKQTFIARDRLGIKPLVFVRESNQLVFASNASAIRGVIPLALSSEAAVDYLLNAYVPESHSIWAGLTKLPPAHFMIVGDNGEVACRRYWEPTSAPQWTGSIDDACMRLDELLLDAVKLQMRSDVPVGVLLSGGIDSSAIVSYASSIASEPLRTYSVNFQGKSSADANYARKVAEQYGTEHTELMFGPTDTIKTMDEVLSRFDEPIADSAMFPTYAISQVARDSGVKVLLSGAGGDEIFGGYPRYGAPRFASPRWLAEKTPAVLGRPLAALWRLIQPSRGWAASDPSFSWGQCLSGVDYGVLRSLLRYPPDFLRGLRSLKAHYPVGRTNVRIASTYERMLIDLRTYLIGDVLALTDKASMAASVECRVPLLDHRLVEFAFSLPESINLLRGAAKGLFRETLRDKLPADLLCRAKEGFNAPIAVWLDGGGKQIRDELLGAACPLVDGIIDRAKLERLLLKGNVADRSAETVFALFMLNRWCRMQGEAS
jgi:asparagine synthase (glutamine-hydrolysing)